MNQQRLHTYGPIARRHPLTGAPIEPLYIDRHGRQRWPIMGGDGTNDGGTGGQGGDGSQAGSGGQGSEGSQGGSQGGQGGQGSNGGQGGTGGNTGSQGGSNDLGFPRDTPIAEMTIEQQAAYWKHQSRKHESTWKDIVGDRKVDDVKNDLAEAERIRQEKLTPSEKALQEAEQRGRAAAATESLTRAATAIVEAQLKAAGKSDEDRKDLMDGINVSRFIENGDIDTDRLTEFVAKIAPADTGTGGGSRDYGAGRRENHTSSAVATGAQRYQERHGKKTAASS